MALVHRPRDAAEVVHHLRRKHPRGVLARGLGRCYGDAAQNAGGSVLALDGIDRILELDRAAGRATVEAGLSLGALARETLRHGWLPPVLPGTQHVTVGGAIAADIHGKNHHRDGSFSRHVESIELITPAGERLTAGPERESELFRATTGGMGLTGIVLAATIRLMRVEGPHVSVDRERARDLDDAMARMESGDHRYRYSVAWVDCLASGARLGRSVIIRGNHASADGVRSGPGGRTGRLRLAAPRWTPAGLLRPATVRAFNEVWFRRAPREERGRLEPLHSFFHPLDWIEGWNRLYGPRGFVQYQFVVPFGEEGVIRIALERLTGARCPSFLAVLKRMGPGQSGPMSFPGPGWTLALDVPADVAGLAELLDGLDAIVAEAGGRVYLAKDARLRPELLPAMYPGLERWREVRERVDRDAAMRSDLARRLSLA